MPFINWHLTECAKEVEQESQGKRHSARQQLAGIITHLFIFLNMPWCYQQTASFLYQAGSKYFNEISLPIFIWTFFEYQGTQFLEIIMS